MVRAFIVSIALCACAGERPLPDRPLPPLQEDRQQVRSLANAALLLFPGEVMTWNVRWRGFAVGVATLEVTEVAGRLHVRSRFRARGLAAQVKALRRSLVSEQVPPARHDDLHSALARVRSWAVPGAPPVTLSVAHDRELYRVRLASPEHETVDGKRAVRIEGDAVSKNSRVVVTLWIQLDPKRVPLRATFARDGESIRAELIEYRFLPGSL